MRFFLGCLTLALVSGRPLGLSAQTTGANSFSCDSLLRAAYVDSVGVTARAYLLRRDGEVLPPRARSLLLETILAHYTAPKPLQLPVFSAGPARLRMLMRETLGDSLSIREPVVYGVYSFTLWRNGAMSPIVTTIRSMVPRFDESIVAAITAAAADSAQAVVPRALNVDSLPLELRINTGPEDTRFRVPPVPLFTAIFPRVRLAEAKPVGTNPLPPYPEEERDEGRDGDVLLRVVIDATGAPLIPTLEVLHATSSAFALSAARTLARYRFVPAHVGACTVPQVLELPFWFSLRP